jgi:formylglycine-generating enzyme required for sulfatase activity
MKNFLMRMAMGLVLSAAAACALAAAPVAMQDDLQKLAPGTVFRDCEVCPDMVVLAPGTFRMGSPATETTRMDREGPVQTITFTRPFAVGKFEITRGEFARFVQETNREMGGCNAWDGATLEYAAGKNWREPGFAQTDSDPVVCVNWQDANAYGQWLAQKSGKSYRLPSEAEWEYAARAGNPRTRPWGDNANEACRYANVADQTAKKSVRGGASWFVHECEDGKVYTAPVGSFQPNAFGLHDMIGNAWEWAGDCWNASLVGAPADGATRNGDCTRRMVRGASWQSYPGLARSAMRARAEPDNRSADYGFRVVRGN